MPQIINAHSKDTGINKSAIGLCPPVMCFYNCVVFLYLIFYRFLIVKYCDDIYLFSLKRRIQTCRCATFL